MATSDDPENFVPQDCFNITIPVSFLTENTTGECSVLVEIDHHDATLLDFEGASGAIGRFEADENGLTLDLKGYQYDGMIHPGPTTMILALRGGELKVDAMTDEFVSLTKTTNVMAKLNAVVQGSMDASYNVVDDDINKKEQHHIAVGGLNYRAENNIQLSGVKRKGKSGRGGNNCKTTTGGADGTLSQRKKRPVQSRKKMKAM